MCVFFFFLWNVFFFQWVLFLLFQSHLEQAHIDKVHGAFSTVDVDQVDMYKFPGLQTIPYFKAVMEPGDCFFIPAR